MHPDMLCEVGKENKKKLLNNRISKLLKIINDEESVKKYLFSEDAIFKKYKNENFIEMVIHFDDVEKVVIDIDGVYIEDINGHKQKI